MQCRLQARAGHGRLVRPDADFRIALIPQPLLRPPFSRLRFLVQLLLYCISGVDLHGRVAAGFAMVLTACHAGFLTYTLANAPLCIELKGDLPAAAAARPRYTTAASIVGATSASLSGASSARDVPDWVSGGGSSFGKRSAGKLPQPGTPAAAAALADAAAAVGRAQADAAYTATADAALASLLEPTPSQLASQQRCESLLQFFATTAVAQNVVGLILVAWPAADSVLATTANEHLSSCLRAFSVFFFALAAGQSMAVRRIFQIMLPGEVALREHAIAEIHGQPLPSGASALLISHVLAAAAASMGGGYGAVSGLASGLGMANGGAGGGAGLPGRISPGSRSVGGSSVNGGGGGGGSTGGSSGGGGGGSSASVVGSSVSASTPSGARSSVRGYNTGGLAPAANARSPAPAVVAPAAAAGSTSRLSAGPASAARAGSASGSTPSAASSVIRAPSMQGARHGTPSSNTAAEVAAVSAAAAANAAAHAAAAGGISASAGPRLSRFTSTDALLDTSGGSGIMAMPHDSMEQLAAARMASISGAHGGGQGHRSPSMSAASGVGSAALVHAHSMTLPPVHSGHSHSVSGADGSISTPHHHASPSAAASSSAAALDLQERLSLRTRADSSTIVVPLGDGPSAFGRTGSGLGLSHAHGQSGDVLAAAAAAAGDTALPEQGWMSGGIGREPAGSFAEVDI